MKIISIPIIAIILVICIVFGVFFGAFVWALEKSEAEELEVVTFLSEYDTNREITFWGDGRIYKHNNEEVLISDLISYPNKLLYATEDEFFYYSFDKNTKVLSVYRSDYSLENNELIFSNIYTKNVRPYMYDVSSIYFVSDIVECYDILNAKLEQIEGANNAWEAYLIGSEYSYSKERVKFGDSRYKITVTRKSDNVTKTFTKDDILKVYQAEQLEKIAPLGIEWLEIKDGEIYVVCENSFYVATVYKYDFDTEEFSFYAWRDVLDTEGMSSGLS